MGTHGCIILVGSRGGVAASAFFNVFQASAALSSPHWERHAGSHSCLFRVVSESSFLLDDV